MNTLQSQWQSYADRVLPKDAPDVQRTECRRAFYAGAQAYFSMMLGAGDNSEDAAVAMMGGWQEELAAFVSDVQAGRA